MSANTASADSKVAHVVVGTAGHIDHGKSSLVRKLTGHDPDRLPEEKARGITIDLGYAGRPLPDGRVLGFIDVPGHERFIKNMVAGATGVDVTVLVVAADDGVMPQTREHLAILELLGMQRVIVALTKSDLVDAEMLELAADDVRAFLAKSSFANAPLIPCSSTTGAGVEELWEVLLATIAEVTERPQTGVFRMPIQRTFSVKGFGTVVTGVPLGGEIAVGDLVEVLPGNLRGKVRGLQAYDQQLMEAGAGHRTAVNVADIDYKSVQRGMVLATPGMLNASSHVSVRLHALPLLDEAIAEGTQVRFHTGTAEVIGEIAMLEGGDVAPGTSALVQIVLDEPVVAVPGDRFILRLHSPMLTLGGGVVLRLDERRLKRKRDWILRDLTHRERAVGNAELMADYLLGDSGRPSVSAVDLVREAAALPAVASQLLAARAAAGVAIEVAPGRFASVTALAATVTAVLESLQRFHAEHPERYREDVLKLRHDERWDDAVLDRALATLVAEGKIVHERGTVRLADAPPPSPALVAIREQIVRVIRERGFEAPRRSVLAEEIGLDEAHTALHLSYLAESGALVKIADDLYMTTESVEATRAALMEAIAAGGELDTNEFKNRLGVSRKFLIPLLEHFDAVGLTVRDGSKRFLRSKR